MLKKAWKKVKNVAKAAAGGLKAGWKTLRGLAGQAINLLKEVGNRVLGILDFAATLLGIRLPKKLRLRIAILRDESGASLVSEDEARMAIDRVKAVLDREMRVRVYPAPGGLSKTLPQAAPTVALDVGCDRKAWEQDLGTPGGYFRGVIRDNDWVLDLVGGYGAPITIFVVRDVKGEEKDKRGCSLGIFTDYVTVDIGDIGFELAHPFSAQRYRSIAHELGHACGLWHVGGERNLMKPGADGTHLSRLQRAIFRNSRHVTFF